MVIREAEGSFILVGFSVQLEFSRKRADRSNGSPWTRAALKQAGGSPGRRLNGDELRLDMGEEVTVWRLSLESF